MALSWFEHRGRRILRNDLRDLSEAEAIAQLENEIRLLEAEPAKVRVLVDVSDAPLHLGFVTRARALAPRIEARVERHAVVGATGLKAMLLAGFNLVSADVPLKPFPDEEAAKDYLAS